MSLPARTVIRCLCILICAVALPAQGAIQPVDITPSGQSANGHSSRVAVSADARWIVFSSTADDLVANDTNQRADVFVRDRATGTIELVSIADSGQQADGDSFAGGVSDDGRLVCFCSAAGNLVPGDDNDCVDVFVRDRQLGNTRRVSVGASGQQADAASSRAMISGDGTTVAFHSVAGNLVPGDTNGVCDVFVHTLASGVVERVSVGTAGGQANAPCFEPDLSTDGRFVVFHTVADNLGPVDGNAQPDVYLRDRLTAVTERISIAIGGGETNGVSHFGACSGDGGRIVFVSTASNLVAGDGNAAMDVFVRDRSTAVTRRVSVSSAGQQGTGFVGNIVTRPDIGADGRFVVFASRLNGLAAVPPDPWEHVFVHDLQTLATTLVSRASTGEPANSGAAILSYDWTPVGRNVAIAASPAVAVFDCAADNLWPHDFDAANDIFAVDVGLHVDAVGVATPGGSADVVMAAPGHTGQLFVAAWSQSVASGVMLPGQQWLPLDSDALLAGTLSLGVIDAAGVAAWSAAIPAQAGLVGSELHAAAVVLDLSGPTLFPAISNVATFVVQ